MKRVVARLEQDVSTPETRPLAARLAVLTGELRPAAAVARYRRIRDEAGNALRFTWTGVKDSTRVDSYFDRFGNLTIAQRAAVETAREARQLRAYWTEHVNAVS
jgi:hypothetical protein